MNSKGIICETAETIPGNFGVPEHYSPVIKKGRIRDRKDAGQVLRQGDFHRMSREHLHRYPAEFSGRRNIRTFDTIDRMETVAPGIGEKRLKRRDLIA